MSDATVTRDRLLIEAIALLREVDDSEHETDGMEMALAARVDWYLARADRWNNILSRIQSFLVRCSPGAEVAGAGPCPDCGWTWGENPDCAGCIDLAEREEEASS